MKDKIFSIFEVSIYLLLFFSIAPALASAAYTEDPSGCYINAVTLGITAFRDDGVTPIGGGTVVAGETIKYQAFLSTSGYPSCYYEGGTVHIHLPDGTQTDVTPIGGIPRITTSNSPFPSLQATYVVDMADLDVNDHIIALAHYMDGVSLTPTAPSEASAETSFPLPFQAQDLTVEKDANPAIEETYTWSIQKSVDPAEWELFDGETGTSEYTVSVEKTLAGTLYSVSGTITITNPSEYVSAHLTGVTDSVSGVGAATVDCPVSFPYDLAPLAQLVCTYDMTLPDATTRINTATVTTTGEIGGSSGTADVDFSGVNPTVVNDEIDVDDTNGGSWHFSDSGSVTYEKTFDCEGLSYTNDHASYSHQNTATIRGTAMQDDANVDVDCYRLSAGKTADTSFDRTYVWDIEKDGSTRTLYLEPGETASVDYEVTVSLGTPMDHDFSVSGTITVHNPAPIAATINSVSDAISGVGAATVDCGVAFPYTLAAGGDLVCTYDSALPSGTERTNTATATQQLYDYDKDKVATPDGTKDYSGDAAITFDANSPDNVIDDCIVVYDTFAGFLGTVCVNDAPETFLYSRQVGPYPRSECGTPKYIDNTASFTTDDTQATGDDPWTVTVNVPCPVPEEGLKVYFLKKSFDFCDDGIHPEDGDEDIPGGAVPDGFDVQSSGCVDRWADAEQDRRDNYAFTGEQVAELVVARDLDGAIAITQAMLLVDGDEIAYCNELAPRDVCASGWTGNWDDCSWKGHTGDSFDAHMNEFPPQGSESTVAGFDPLYDKLFECFLTVTDDMEGEAVITVEVYDYANDLIAWTYDQMWYLNPEVSLDISMSDGAAVEFEPGYAGDTVYSTNKLLMENDAEGGVDIAVWLGGTDLTSPSALAKCPWSNVLDVEGIEANGHTYNGMDFRCSLDSGIYTEQTWQDVLNKNLKEDCTDVSDGDGEVETCLGLNPIFYGHENVLKNGHEMECRFKLQYPVPCIGEFTDGNLVILMRAV